MAPLGSLSLAWTQAEAALPLGWRIRGLWQFDEQWIALSVGAGWDDYLSGSGMHADQALRRLGDRLRVLRGPLSG